VLHNPLSTTDTVTSGWHSDSEGRRQKAGDIGAGTPPNVGRFLGSDSSGHREHSWR